MRVRSASTAGRALQVSWAEPSSIHSIKPPICSLFPSKTETQGLAVGEALASGLPCVVVNAGGAPESVRDGVDGFLVEDDAAQMAARTLELLADPMLCRRLSEEAKRGAAARTPESVGGRMVAVYEELIAARREDKGRRSIKVGDARPYDQNG